jgi:hypothetical protein
MIKKARYKMVPLNSNVIKEPIQEHRNNGAIVEIHENLKPVKDLAWTYNITAASISAPSISATPPESRLFCDATGKLIGGVFTSVDNDNKITHTMILSKGHIQTLHRYPHICDSLPFKSTMNNWQNLFFTQGVTVCGPTANENLSDGTHCLNAVITNKTLPLGLISSTTNYKGALSEKIRNFFTESAGQNRPTTTRSHGAATYVREAFAADALGQPVSPTKPE